MIVLRVYKAPSGQWSGRLMDGDVEVGGIAGCATADEVEEVAYEQGYDFLDVEMVQHETR